MVTKSSAANAERVKRRMGVPLTKSARDNITCRVVKSTAMELAARTNLFLLKTTYICLNFHMMTGTAVNADVFLGYFLTGAGNN